jgi:hypothetical protein
MNDRKVFWSMSGVTFVFLVVLGVNPLVAALLCIPFSVFIFFPFIWGGAIIFAIGKVIYENLLNPIWKWLHR